jgi:hypothetical protein
VNERCPVTVDEFSTPSHEIQFQSVSVRFCCEKCQARFQADPARYVANLPQLSPEMVEKTILDARGDAWRAQATSRLDRWTRPALLGAAGLIALWLAARLVRRRRGTRAHASS